MSSVSESNTLVRHPMFTAAADVHGKFKDPASLPQEIVENVFKYLTTMDAGKAACASRTWKLVLELDRTSSPLKKGQNQTYFSREVISEISTFGYHKDLVRVLRKSNILLSRLPKQVLPNPIRSPRPEEMNVAILRLSESGHEKIIFRMIGDPDIIEQIFNGWFSTFQTVTVAFAFFKESNCFQLYANDCLLPGRAESLSSNAQVDYSSLDRLLSNPISIIWLYCASEKTPYIDLTQYIPVPGPKAHIY